MRWVSEPVTRVQAGRILTGSFQLINFSEQERIVEGEWVLPEGWRALTPVLQEFSLEAGESRPVAFALQINNEQVAGTYKIYYQAKSLDAEQLRDQLMISVEVEAKAAISTAVLAAPRIAVPGESFSVTVNVTNKGNCTSQVSLNAQDHKSARLQLRPDDQKFTLLPGERRAITATVTTESGVDYGKFLVFTYVFEASDCKGGKILATQKVRVEMLPPPGAGDSPYVLHPGMVRLTTLYDRKQWDYQIELEGNGWLDETQTRRFGYYLRPPSADDDQQLGTNGSFRFNYDVPGYSFQFGDSGYSLSRLTEQGHYGRGVRVGHTDTRNQMSVYFMDDFDDGVDASRRFGANWRYKAAPTVTVGANYFNRQSEIYEDDIFSMEFLWREERLFDLSGEMGFCSTSRQEADNPNDFAAALNARWWNGQGAWAESRFLYAGPDYQGGGVQDQLSLHLNAQYPLDEITTTRVTLKRDQYNLDPEESDSASSLEYLAQAQVTRALKRDFGFEASLGALLEYQEMIDRLEPRDYDRSSMSFGLNWEQRLGILNWRGLGMFGRAEDAVRDETTWLERYDVSATLRFSARFRTDFTWKKGPPSFRSSSEGTESLGARFSWVPTTGIDLSGGYRVTIPEDGSTLRRRVNANLRWDAWFGHNLEAAGSYEWQDDDLSDPQTYCRLVYTIPYDLPVGIRRQVGTVRGRVHMDGAGLPGVVVRLDGSAALTDAQGYYIFTAKPVGTYTFHMDPGALAPGQIVDLPPPIVLKVEPGVTAEFDLPVVLESHLVGKLMLPPDSPALEDPAGHVFQGMAEIKRSDEVLRIPVLPNGEFVFSGIRPGAWELRFLDVPLPVRHRFEQERLSVVVAPGQTLSLEPAIRFQEYNIRMIDKGTLKVSP